MIVKMRINIAREDWRFISAGFSIVETPICITHSADTVGNELDGL
jgi:hypothetical protein